jgi:hypothetical protein
MFHHPITKQEIKFKSKEDLIYFLQRLNPYIMREFKKQYKAKYPDFEIIDFGLKVEIRKISKKDK